MQVLQVFVGRLSNKGICGIETFNDFPDKDKVVGTAVNTSFIIFQNLSFINILLFIVTI
jgi:hypothetical protein